MGIEVLVNFFGNFQCVLITYRANPNIYRRFVVEHRILLVLNKAIINCSYIPDRESAAIIPG